MKADSLSVVVPNKGCAKACPYCVSRMTDSFDTEFDTMMLNAPTVKKFAERAGINNVIFTSKGEPLENMQGLSMLINEFRDLPKEVHTDGEPLKDPNVVIDLANSGIHIVAISVDSQEQFKTLLPAISIFKHMGLIVRINVIVNDGFSFSEACFPEWWIMQANKAGVRHVTFRKLTFPKDVEETPELEWIRENTHNNQDFFKMLSWRLDKSATRGLITAHGEIFYDYMGVSIILQKKCIQEHPHENAIRSLIFQTDGHLYTHWGRKGSIIF